MVANKYSVEHSYVLIMPCRDEEEYLAQTMECIVAQSILPKACIIVDDGSKDRTLQIANEYAVRYPWVRVVHRHDRGERKVGGGVVDAFYSGYELVKSEEFEFICKTDSDMTFSSQYFEKLFTYFDANPRLGGASGKVFNPVGDGLVEEYIVDDMVSGQLNFWRRRCWEEIGGYVREVMWDGIVFHRCRMLGWQTRSFRDEDLDIVHHRLMGSSHRSIFHGRLRWGRGQWFMGTHPLYVVASGIFRMRERPYFLGGMCIILGYFASMLSGVPRYGDAEFRRHLRHWQLHRLKLGFLAPKVPPQPDPCAK